MLKKKLGKLFKEFDSDMIEEVFEMTGLGDKKLEESTESQCKTMIEYILKAKTIQGEDVTGMHDEIKIALNEHKIDADIDTRLDYDIDNRDLTTTWLWIKKDGVTIGYIEVGVLELLNNAIENAQE